MEYREALAGLYARHNSGIKLGLETTRALLAQIGHPERRMRHVVVAGTNGKGSTTALLAGALRAAGHRVGHYTSPHLLRFTERIRVDGEELAPDDAVRLYQSVTAEESALPRAPTFFEVTTAMALQAFAERGVQIAVLEVGLGGRLDATNAVDRALSVITPIGLDHQAYLGNTLAEIAAEKAGIIAKGVRVVSSAQAPAARDVIQATAIALRAPLSWAQDAVVEQERTRLRVAGREDVWLPYVLEGDYQRTNLGTAASACAALHDQGIACPPEALAQTAAGFRWPGRYQWLAGAIPVLLDGAHNAHGVAALAQSLALDVRLRGRPIHCVVTALADRDADDLARPLAGQVAKLYACPVSSRRSRTEQDLAAAFPAAIVCSNTASALARARDAAETDGGVVLVTGSLFLIGEALAHLTGEPRDPPIDA